MQKYIYIPLSKNKVISWKCNKTSLIRFSLKKNIIWLNSTEFLKNKKNISILKFTLLSKFRPKILNILYIFYFCNYFEGICCLKHYLGLKLFAILRHLHCLKFQNMPWCKQFRIRTYNNGLQTMMQIVYLNCRAYYDKLPLVLQERC